MNKIYHIAVDEPGRETPLIVLVDTAARKLRLDGTATSAMAERLAEVLGNLEGEDALPRISDGGMFGTGTSYSAMTMVSWDDAAFADTLAACLTMAGFPATVKQS